MTNDNSTPILEPFKRLREVREMLRQQAAELIAEYMVTAKEAREAGEFEAAGKMIWNLIEHMPAEEDGTKLVDVSVDKQPKIDNKKTDNRIQILLAPTAPMVRQLPTKQVLDAEVTNADSD